MSKPLRTKAPTYDQKPAPSAAQAPSEPSTVRGMTLDETLAFAREHASEGAKRLTVDVRPELSKRFDSFCHDHEVKKGPIMRALLEEFLSSKGY